MRHHVAILILSDFVIHQKYLAVAAIVVAGVAFYVFSLE